MELLITVVNCLCIGGKKESSNPTQPSPVQPSPTQSNQAQPNQTQPSPTQPSQVQPSPAQSDPAQPNQTQPSPAQRQQQQRGRTDTNGRHLTTVMVSLVPSAAFAEKLMRQGWIIWRTWRARVFTTLHPRRPRPVSAGTPPPPSLLPSRYIRCRQTFV